MIQKTSLKAVILLVMAAFYLMEAEGAEQEINLLVNQAGYDALGPKRIWLQANFEPFEITSFEIVRGEEVIYQGAWDSTQKIESWDRWYRVGNFSSYSRPGDYRLRIRWRGQIIESLPFRIDNYQLAKRTGPLAGLFFFIQRCGTEVPGWHAPCHGDDAKMPDGSHWDLVGGWHDAGDYNKYNGYTPLAVYALAKFSESPAAHFGQEDDNFPGPLEEALWGASWLRKCQHPESKKVIYAVFSGFRYWGIPEMETDNLPRTADDRPVLFPFQWNENELTVAAYAVLSRNKGDSSLEREAIELWNVVEQQELGTNIPQRAKRLLAAVELFRTTGDIRLQKKAESDAEFLIEAQQRNGAWPAWAMALVDFGMPAASLAEFALAFPDSALSPQVLKALEHYMDFWALTRCEPFDIPKWNENEYFYPYLSDKWYIGQNSMYLSQAWAGLLIRLILPRERVRALAWAYGCLDWILGANPLGICMMFSAGKTHLKRYHHRYETIPNGEDGHVPGAICNGITRERSDLDRPYLDLKGNSWQTNEPWLPHNAYYLLVLSALEEEPFTPIKKKKKRL